LTHTDIENQFFVGHVVPQVFLLESLEFFVLPGCLVRPGFIDNVSECGKLYPFLQTVLFPFIGEFLADFNGL
jgi:hypothetical protein